MVPLFLTIPLTLISIIGLILNGCIFVLVLLTKQISTANNILLLHLGTINILLGVLFLIFSVSGYKGSEWSPTGTPCVLHGFLFTLFHPVALWTICGLNCDRYYVIAAPLHYNHIVSTKKVMAALGAGWTIFLLLCSPPLFNIAPYSYIPEINACVPNFHADGTTLWYAVVFTFVTLCVPVTIIICCNVKVLMIARYHRHRIASAIYEVTLSAQVTITHQRNPFFVPTVTAPSSGGPKFRGRSAIYSVLELVGAVLVLYVPYYVIVMWEAIAAFLNSSTEKFLPVHLHVIASSLLVFTVPVNGFLYGIKSKTLRKTLKNYWRKKQTKSEVKEEIQARTPSTCGSRRPSLTPLGFLAKHSFQRRMSETLLDVNKAMRSPNRSSKIKRIASEIAWRPSSANSLNLSPKEDNPHKIMTHTTSCNTLQVPTDETKTLTEDEIYVNVSKTESPKNNQSHLLLQKLFKIEQERQNSPRILITRAFSEESEKGTPHRQIAKKHSTSATTLLERKWRQLRHKDGNEDADCQRNCHTTKPLLDNGNNRSSESSETSESSGRICIALDDKITADQSESESNEEQLLLCWNTHKKYARNEDARKTRPVLLNQTVQSSQEVVL